MINKRRILKLAFASFVFAVVYSIGLSVTTGFELSAFLKNTLVLTVIFVIVTNIVDFLLQILLKAKRN